MGLKKSALFLMALMVPFSILAQTAERQYKYEYSANSRDLAGAFGVSDAAQSYRGTLFIANTILSPADYCLRADVKGVATRLLDDLEAGAAQIYQGYVNPYLEFSTPVFDHVDSNTCVFKTQTTVRHQNGAVSFTRDDFARVSLSHTLIEPSTPDACLAYSSTSAQVSSNVIGPTRFHFPNKICAVFSDAPYIVDNPRPDATCEATGGFDFATEIQGTPNQIQTFGIWTATATPCTVPADLENPPGTQEGCGPGSALGTVNGIPACIPGETPPEQPTDPDDGDDDGGDGGSGGNTGGGNDGGGGDTGGGNNGGGGNTGGGNNGGGGNTGGGNNGGGGDTGGGNDGGGGDTGGGDDGGGGDTGGGDDGEGGDTGGGDDGGGDDTGGGDDGGGDDGGGDDGGGGDTGGGDDGGDGDTDPPVCPPGQRPGNVNGSEVCVTPGPTDPTDPGDGGGDDGGGDDDNPGGGDTGGGDGDGDTPGGGGDGDGDSAFSGTCETGIFTCKGDAVTCAIAKEIHRQGCTAVQGEGDCLSEFVCQGDAISCSIARQQRDHQCSLRNELFKDDYSLASEYEAEMGAGGNDPGGVRDRVGGDIVNIDSLFDTSSMIGSGSCPNDMSVSFMGREIVFPLSKFCPFFIWMGHLLVLVAVFSGMRIITGGL